MKKASRKVYLEEQQLGLRNDWMILKQVRNYRSIQNIFQLRVSQHKFLALLFLLRCFICSANKQIIIIASE